MEWLTATCPYTPCFGFLGKWQRQMTDSHWAALTTILQSSLPTAMFETPHERHHCCIRFKKLFVIFQEASDEAGPPWDLVSMRGCTPCSPLMCHQRDTSGAMYPLIPGQGVTYPPEVLLLLINNRGSLIYAKHQTFTQLHLAEVNLAACWDLKIMGISTELMASRMWSKVCFILAVHALLLCLALSGLPALMFNQTALPHWVNLVGNGASMPVCDKQLNFTLFECQFMLYNTTKSETTWVSWHIWTDGSIHEVKVSAKKPTTKQPPRPKQKKPQGKK